MTEFEYFSEINTVLRRAIQAEQDPDRRENLEALRRETWARVQFHQANGSPGFLFAIHGAFLHVGPLNAPQVYPHPNLRGIDDAWVILAGGVSGNAYLTAADVVGDGKRPGNTLRNRLGEAADWLDTVAHVPALARALRRPCIEIGRDDGITYRPAMHPPIQLML